MVNSYPYRIDIAQLNAKIVLVDYVCHGAMQTTAPNSMQICSDRCMVKMGYITVLVHGQMTITFVVSVGLSVCLSVCLFVCAEFFSAVFDPISIKLGHMLYL